MKKIDLTKMTELIQEFLTYPEVRYKLSKYMIWRDFEK